MHRINERRSGQTIPQSTVDNSYRTASPNPRQCLPRLAFVLFHAKPLFCLITTPSYKHMDTTKNSNNSEGLQFWMRQLSSWSTSSQLCTRIRMDCNFPYSLPLAANLTISATKDESLSTRPCLHPWGRHGCLWRQLVGASLVRDLLSGGDDL